MVYGLGAYNNTNWAQGLPEALRPEAVEQAPEAAPPPIYDQWQRDPKLERENAIRTKIDLGKRLNDCEKRFLRGHNSELYTSAMRIDHEQRQYEKALKKCKTRSERKQLHQWKTMSILASAKTRGPAAAKDMTTARLNALNRTHHSGRWGGGSGFSFYA